MKNIAYVFGTRPEAIKMAPLISATAESSRFNAITILTGQHPTMAREVLDWFGLVPNFEQTIDRSDPSLNGLVSQLILQVGQALKDCMPDLVVVQGDTASALAGALAAFNLELPVAHVEAGLRTDDINSPYPEEAYRQMISRIAQINLCPTPWNKSNLLSEGIDESSIMITGNTVVDAFALMSGRMPHGARKDIAEKQKTILVTVHRRENLGGRLIEITKAIKELAIRNQDFRFVLPMHPNPKVRQILIPSLGEMKNVSLIEPLGYPDFLAELENSTFVLSDSGGVQEEAPILGVPVLVMRDNTERPEGLMTGGMKLVGANALDIVSAAEELIYSPQLRDSMATAMNPFGDGLASARTISAFLKFFGLGQRQSEYVGHS